MTCGRNFHTLSGMDMPDARNGALPPGHRGDPLHCRERALQRGDMDV